MKNKTKIIDVFETVFNASKDCKLQAETVVLLDKELELIANYLTCSKTEAFFVANVFNLCLGPSYITINDLKQYFNCEFADIIKYNTEFLKLIEQSFLDVADMEQLDLMINTCVHFKCNDLLRYSVIKNREFNFSIKYKGGDKFKFVYDLYDLINSNISSPRNKEDNVLNDAFTLIEKNENHSLNIFFEANRFDIVSKLIFACVLWKFLKYNRGFGTDKIFQIIYEEDYKAVSKSHSIALGHHFLIENKFLLNINHSVSHLPTLYMTTQTNQQLIKVGFEFYKEHLLKVRRNNAFLIDNVD